MLNVLLQAVEAEQEVASLNLFELAKAGGWIMIPLLLLCMLAIYIFVERLIVIRKASVKDPLLWIKSRIISTRERSMPR